MSLSLGHTLPVLLLVFATNSVANNITLSDAFDGEGPQMAPSPLSCNGAGNQAYQEIGTISVTATGNYEFADVGNLLGFNNIGEGIVDIVISVYDGAFDSASPASNRIAAIDEGQGIELDSGVGYTLVIQPYCDNQTGVFAVVIRGPGTISGAGFASPAHTFGEHGGGDDTAVFPDIGEHAYDAGSVMQVPATGLYHFGEVGAYFNADIMLFVYQGSFNPANTAQNLVASVTFAGSLFLEAGTDYVFVAVDVDDLMGEWQYALFPPGQVFFNSSLRGAWVTPGVEGSGIMVEVGEETGILFFAWFTFPQTAQVASAAKNGTSPQDSGGTASTSNPGSSDQRWLTAAGLFEPGARQVNLFYENTTGGAFNQALPVPATDSSYGTGDVELHDCGHMTVTYDLQGGIAGSAEVFRIIPDGEAECFGSVFAAPITP